MKTIVSVLALVAASLFFGCQTTFGQFILSPVGVTESGLGTFSPQTAGPTNMINQSGLGSATFVSGVTGFDAYFTPNDKFSQNADGTKWQSNYSIPPDPSPTGNLDFDLGANYNINKIAIWNVSVKIVTIIVSADQAGLDSMQPVGTFTLPDDNTAAVSMLANLIDFGGTFQGRFVRLHIESEYPYHVNNQNIFYAVIGEVAVSALPAALAGPPLSIALQPNGDVKVDFNGALQSKANIQDTFQNVSGNPSSTYTIPKASLGARQFFRTGN